MRTAELTTAELITAELTTAGPSDATPGNIAVVRQIPSGHHVLDVGPETVEHFAKTIALAKTIVYTGLMSTPLAVPAFEGTALVLQRIAESTGFSLVFGDETIRAAQDAGSVVLDGIGHISLGGEATLAFLAGKRMPGIEALRGASNE